MEVKKRKINGHEHKKKKKQHIEEDNDIETNYFESEIMFHSTVTKMKVNALLNEVTLKEAQRNEIDEFIERISNEIKSIPQGKIRDLSKMSEWLEKFDIKIPLSFSKMNKKFQFLPPIFIQPIGSYTSNTLIIKSKNQISTIIDLLIEIPHICIHKKDYLNNEYIEKRAIYLCYLAKKLKYSIEFSHLNNTTLNQTVLIIKPNNDQSTFAIRILLVPEQDYFNEKRLISTSSNLRWNWFKDDNNKEDNEPFYSTSNYNSLILFDCRCRATSDYLNKIFSSSNELANGLKLFKIWLEQRQLSYGFGSFEGAMPAFFLAYLLHTNKINKQMYSYQIFRILLVGLTENDFSSSEYCSLTNEKILENIFDKDDCILIDHSGLLNVFHTLTRANYKRLKYEARISLNSFNDPVIDHFQVLFMTSMEPIYNMDAIIQISSIDQYEKLLEEKSNKDQLILDNLNNKHYLLSQEILHLLEYGLKERINLICPLPSINQRITTWPINQSVPPRTSITFGIIFSDQYDLSVLKGPENGTKEAQLFRKLWSERCELRRFPDGSILESVVWNVESAKDKRLIWIDVTRYLLEIQAGISPNQIEFIHNDQILSSLLSIPTRIFPSYGTGDEQQIYLCRELVDLSKQIRLLNSEELPLKINNIIGIDEIFRYTNVFPPLPSLFQTDLHKIRSIEHDTYALIPRSTSRYAPPYNQSLIVLCQLEITSSNDKDFETIERIKHSKILYYIKLAKLLKEKFNLITRATIDCCYIEKNNYIYKIILSYHKEIYLIESQAGKKDGLERIIKQTNISKKLRYNTEYLPKINAAIYGVSQQFVHYQLVARIFKRWLSSQMLLYHFDPINADLVCCYVFLHSNPPKSILTGFCRILRLLRDFDWINEPLIINFNHELTKEQIFEMQTQFKNERSNLPPLCLMPSIGFHENTKPTVPIFKRIIQLAKEALNYLEINTSDSIKFLFRPSIKTYDVIIILDPLQCPRAYQAVDHITTEVTYTTRKKTDDSDQIIDKKLLSIVDYDPPQLLIDELRTSYNNQAEFFHDEFGGLMICVLWKPSKSTNIDYVKIIDQWKLLGTGIIKEIQTFPERWC